MFETILFVGGAFGVKHAFEADHLAAVATLVKDEDSPISTGMAWGIGHSVPVLVLGALFLGLDVQIPADIVTGFELLVAAVLVALGLRVIAGRDAFGTALLRRLRRDDPGEHHTKHRHVSVAGDRVGLTHSSVDEESFAVGIIHGLAGSGGVVVALAASAPDVSSGVGFLASFAIATTLAMGVASWGWGRFLGRTRAFRVVAGIASVAVGLLLFVETAGIGVPL